MPQMNPILLLDAYPWASTDSAVLRTIIDVGGSHGSVAMALVSRFPTVNCIVQDLPEVIEGLEEQHLLDGRLTFMAHDFFREQPVKDADVYFFRNIFHDWSDKYSVQILRALVPALKDGAAIIICDTCLPKPDTVPADLERRLR